MFGNYLARFGPFAALFAEDARVDVHYDRDFDKFGYDASCSIIDRLLREKKAVFVQALYYKEVFAQRQLKHRLAKIDATDPDRLGKVFTVLFLHRLVSFHVAH